MPLTSKPFVSINIVLDPSDNSKTIIEITDNLENGEINKTTVNPYELSMPISLGECQLEFSSKGNVIVKHVPIDLDLSIKTPGIIKICADLNCRGINLVSSFISIGNDQTYISLRTSDRLNISAQNIDLVNGQLSGGSVKLKSKTNIVLGHAEKKCSVRSVSSMEFEAEETVIFDHLELLDGGNLSVKAKLFDDISSHGHVMGDALIDAPLSKHRLLTQYNANGQQVPLSDWPGAHFSHKIIGPSEQALTEPTQFTVEGQLKTTGKTEILGSDVVSGSFEGKGIDVASFFPYTSFRKAYFCGHKKLNKCHWESIPSNNPNEFVKEIQTPVIGRLIAKGGSKIF